VEATAVFPDATVRSTDDRAGAGQAPLFFRRLLISSWAGGRVLWRCCRRWGSAHLRKLFSRPRIFAQLLGYLMTEAPQTLFLSGHRAARQRIHILFPAQSLGEIPEQPGLWIGLVFAAAFFAAAVRLGGSVSRLISRNWIPSARKEERT